MASYYAAGVRRARPTAHRPVERVRALARKKLELASRARACRRRSANLPLGDTKGQNEGGWRSRERLHVQGDYPSPGLDQDTSVVYIDSTFEGQTSIRTSRLSLTPMNARNPIQRVAVRDLYSIYIDSKQSAGEKLVTSCVAAANFSCQRGVIGVMTIRVGQVMRRGGVRRPGLNLRGPPNVFMCSDLRPTGKIVHSYLERNEIEECN
ncbi:hypothetical protein EVAR_10456_1 [Eumeta japonica]|uniref:Uncharacterized protein n=1 Tax=Eumeta variegata TaxID=151549 RepID=A0A4C1TH94_EUMVA|nr:hypothetical protein EVAR_10456_1 [Eumeta japonica]